MEKIVFFGDSFTYGHGLDSGPGPSKLGWANLLCNMRNASGRNLSQPGSSNLEILWTMLHTEIDPDEIIIVQWSFWDRDCLLDDSNIAKIGPWIESSIPYYKVHSNSDMIKRNWLTISHGLLWLKQRSNSYLMLGNEQHYTGHRLTLNKVVTSESDNNILKLTDKIVPHCFNSQTIIGDIAEDNLHPGPKSNIKWAEFVNTLLDTLN